MLKQKLWHGISLMMMLSSPALAGQEDSSYKTMCSVDQGDVQVEIETQGAAVEVDGKFVVQVFDARGNRYSRHRLEEKDYISEYSSKVVWQQFVGYGAERCEVNWKDSLMVIQPPRQTQVVVHHVPVYQYPETVYVHHHSYGPYYSRRHVVVHKSPRRRHHKHVRVHSHRQQSQSRVIVRPHLKISL